MLLSGKILISTEHPRATWQLWKHTAFIWVPQSVPTVVSRAGAITWTQSFTILHGAVSSFIRTNNVWDESVCPIDYGTSSFLLGMCETEIWTQQGHSFSSLVPLQLEYVPRQLGFGSFLFSPLIFLAFLFLFLIKISEAGTAGSSENCGSFKSQLVMRKQSVGWMLFAVIYACPTPQEFKDSSCDLLCLDFKLGWHAEAAWRAWIWQQRNFRSISSESCVQDGRNLNLLAVFPRGTG